ncbi:MAG TPA: hypothetical protein VGO56_01000 [Pyrinomonadaceae bacterium]|jgi:hypothetical protein|nr:hypothetical protein [Pyrinomonadaceae bacterium]
MITSLWQNTARLPSDFAALQRDSIEELKVKTDAHKQVWADRIDHWDLNQESGNLVFSLKDGMKAVCPAQIIGTYNSKDQTWLWAWANPSIEEKLKVDALKLKKYGEDHHLDRLTTCKWVGTEEDAWAMVSLAVKLCEEQGAYRGPSGSTSVFMAFGEVALSKN